MKLQGRIKAGAVTKKLVNFLCPGDIAVVQHDDIDEIAADSIVQSGAKAVINTGRSMTGRFLSTGTAILLQNNVKVFDTDISLSKFRDSEMIIVLNNDIIMKKYRYKNVCTAVDWNYIRKKQLISKKNEEQERLKFIDNTIRHAADEMDKLVCFADYPKLNAKIERRHVIVVVRNSDSIEEIQALKGYIERYNPVFIGVDGGSDLIINCGYTPDILVGDMDSVSDIGIYKSREIVLHAYEDGYCPCLCRIAAMNVPYKIIAIKGTSEDAALMLSYHKNAELIILVGGHNCMYDFMCKGRAGMASTFITRTLVGDRLVDCKGLGIISPSDNEGKDAGWIKM